MAWCHSSDDVRPARKVGTRSAGSTRRPRWRRSAAFWLIADLIAVWHVPERRRRYLPPALVVFTLLCFAGVRVVSLHHVDSLLYNHPIHGVRIVAITELAGIALVILATYWHPFARTYPDDDASRRSTSADVDQPA